MFVVDEGQGAIQGVVVAASPGEERVSDVGRRGCAHGFDLHEPPECRAARFYTVPGAGDKPLRLSPEP